MHSEIFPLQNYSPRKNSQWLESGAEEGLSWRNLIWKFCAVFASQISELWTSRGEGRGKARKRIGIVFCVWEQGEKFRISKTAVAAQRAGSSQPHNHPMSKSPVSIFRFDFSIHLPFSHLKVFWIFPHPNFLWMIKLKNNFS